MGCHILLQGIFLTQKSKSRVLSLGQPFVTLWTVAHPLEKTLMLGRGQEEKGMTEDEMVGWHH